MNLAVFIAGTFLPMASEAVRMGRVRAMGRARKRELERQATRREAEVVPLKATPAQKPRSPAERLISKRLTAAAREAEATRTKQAFKAREARDAIASAARNLMLALDVAEDVMSAGSEPPFAICSAGVTGRAPLMDETGRVLGPMRRCADCGRLRFSYARRTRVFYAWVSDAAYDLKQLAAAGLQVRRYGDQASLDHDEGRELPVPLVRAFADYQQELGAQLIALGARDAAAWITREQIKVPEPNLELERDWELRRHRRGGAAARLKDDDE